MSRVISLCRYLAFAVLVAMIIGCAGGLRVVPWSVKYQNADLKMEEAEAMVIRSDDPVKMKEDLAKQKALFQDALAGFLEIIENDADGKYTDRAHFSVAEIYTKFAEWDKATQHYQAIVDRSSSGYLGGKARSGIADLRKNREIIKVQMRVYQNRAPLEDEESQVLAADGLYNVAKAYYAIGNYRESIKNYTRLVEEFPGHQQAPQVQFQIGNVYFYQLYDYIGGWAAYNKVITKFPDSFEAKEAVTLLKKTEELLTRIKQDMDDNERVKNKKGFDYLATGRYVPSTELWLMGYDDRAVQNYQSIAGGWEKLRNYPNAVAAYRAVINYLSHKQFAKADALYQIGRLYQQDGQYQRAIDAYDELFEKAPQSTWRDEAIYQQAVCYRSIRELEKAHEAFKGYMSLSRDAPYYTEAEQIVRQMEIDNDLDGFMLYQEQEAGTSDQDANSYPGAVN